MCMEWLRVCAVQKRVESNQTLFSEEHNRVLQKNNLREMSFTNLYATKA